MKQFFYCIALLLLMIGCKNKSLELMGIKILTQRDTFNPLLEPDVTRNISILGIYSNEKNEKITDGKVVSQTKKKLDHSPEFNAKEIPFSYFKSSFSVCKNIKTKHLALTDVRFALFARDNEIIEFSYISDSDTLEPNAFATPGKLSLSTEEKVFSEACFESKKIFRLQGESTPMILRLDKDLCLSKRLSITSASMNQYCIKNQNRFGTSYHILTCKKGSLKYREDKYLFSLHPSNDHDYEVSVEESDSFWSSTGAEKRFVDCVVSAQKSFDEFLSKMPTLPEKYKKNRELASYILWSCTVDKGGNYKRPAMLMSKNWMHYIWSWDHCFNAIACAHHFPQMAWDNFMTVFDAQDVEGRLPDVLGYSRIDTRSLKPPIHGWALNKMRNEIKLSDSQIKEAYNCLKRWTNFWMVSRDMNKNGIPEYTQGNDSGWDNGTEFDINGKPHEIANRESANLTAFLIAQMDQLYDLALQLGLKDEAVQWKGKSDKLLSLMLEKQWDGNRFFTLNIDNNWINPESQSLMRFLPIVLGDKLPFEIKVKLIKDLKEGGYITKWGLATESINSPLYQDDGYWRGPIWAPSTMIIVDGLERCGEHELAKEIAERFCDLCAKRGFAENFDAKTGECLRDPAYTWTASCFLILGNYFLK